jgi:hypothetical protein
VNGREEIATPLKGIVLAALCWRHRGGILLVTELMIGIPSMQAFERDWICWFSNGTKLMLSDPSMSNRRLYMFFVVLSYYYYEVEQIFSAPQMPSRPTHGLYLSPQLFGARDAQNSSISMLGVDGGISMGPFTTP